MLSGDTESHRFTDKSLLTGKDNKWDEAIAIGGKDECVVLHNAICKYSTPFFSIFYFLSGFSETFRRQSFKVYQKTITQILHDSACVILYSQLWSVSLLAELYYFDPFFLLIFLFFPLPAIYHILLENMTLEVSLAFKFRDLCRESCEMLS